MADAELEYHDHESTCVTVRFSLVEFPPALAPYQNRKIYALAWTTTPWTLIANQALAYSEKASYCLVEDSRKNVYIVAEDLIDALVAKIGSLEKLSTFKGSRVVFGVFLLIIRLIIIISIVCFLGHELAGAKYGHPVSNISLPFLPGEHVNTKSGTGLVHTAPAHGNEDFLIALEHKIPIVRPIWEYF